MKLEDGLAAYLLETLGTEPTITDWEGAQVLPRFLVELYAFRRTTIHTRGYLLASPLAETEYTPETVRKHFDRIRDLAQLDVVFVSSTLPGWNRRRFIEKKISFIIPGTQMYLPLLGLDLREYTRLPMLKNDAKPVSPATQEIALYVLGIREKTKWTGAELAELRGISLMTAHRAFDELESQRAFPISRNGKRRILSVPPNRREAWESLKPRLTNPVARSLVIQRDYLPNYAIPAGISALSKYSEIAEPDIPEYAVKMNDWNRLVKERDIPIIPAAEQGTVRLQLWRYEPRFSPQNLTADLLSVTLSLRGTEDERVAQAIEQTLKAVLC